MKRAHRKAHLGIWLVLSLALIAMLFAAWSTQGAPQ